MEKTLTTIKKEISISALKQKELYLFRTRKEKGKIIGYDYKNEKACQECKYLSLCTKSKTGRSIYRSVDQDILDSLEEQRKLNYDKYKMRQMIIEHPFGTIKRNWQASYFLTRRKVAVTTEMALTYLAYNLKRVINILGVKEIIKRLKEEKRKREPVLS